VGNFCVGTGEPRWGQRFRLGDVGTIGGWGPTTALIGHREQTGTNPSRFCANSSSAAGGTALTASVICGNGSESTSGPPTLTGATLAPQGYSLWRRYNYAVFYESPLFEGVQAKVAWQPNER